MRISVVLMLLCSVQFCLARGKEDSTLLKLKQNYFFYIQSGALVGCQNCELKSPASFTTSMVHGIKIKDRYRIGFGVGLDYYERYRVIPILASLSSDIAGKKNKLFLELNYGGSFAKPLNDQFFESTEINGRAMSNPMVGYRLKADKMRVSFALGYRFQRIKTLQ